MRIMVEQALTQYDYVIIDTAPLSVSNDGVVFGRWAKGLVLVTGRGICERKELKEISESLHAAKVPVLGFIFNYDDLKKTHSNSNYYYYYEDAPRKKSHKK